MTGEFGSLEGKVVLVTGGARGIGEAISRELARAGARVAVGYRSGQEAADAVAAEIGGTAIQGNVGDPAEAQAVIERVEGELGDVDVLVNNAGVTRDTLIARMSDEDWEEVIETNLRGTFNTCRAVSRKMLRRRSGAIVNVTSVVGLHGNIGQANYAASKAGIIGLTKALARELGARGVRVNAVAPGYIATALTDVLSEEIRAMILGNTPLGRLGEPVDVAAAVRFLCSDEAAFITGEVLLVDGGLGM
ncbi:MAG TPA: 3-oxoacyl-[acyl-carrier-protein] reductase [Gaiellaceae bacterium]|jgi:3-oxoacyl-[acyl-carrier protein] reductase|nr:3-oxoacyl-[acyl-carrier-protein] reductase [Gaiellaceae bacterium]